jgi:nucleoside-diphosphate-sugar epimerase
MKASLNHLSRGKLLITGIDGWIAGALARHCRERGYAVTGSARQPGKSEDAVCVGDIDARTDWSDAVAGCEAVAHLAARVHIMDEKSADPLSEFRRVNVDGTFNLARQAAAAGVKRFVFLSSVKVNGESTEPGRPFTADDAPAPEDAYAVSKHEAERALWEIAERTAMEIVVVRAPLVYGPGVKANFKTLMDWSMRGLPLPLGAVTRNRRSLVALDNLADLIVTCLNHPAAANQTFLASDGEDLSTADLVRRMGQALGKSARLFYVPEGLLRTGAALLNRRGVYQRLCGSLQVDIGKTRRLLNWTPPLSVDEGLRRALRGGRR